MPGIYQYGLGPQVVTWSAVALNATAPGSNGGSSTITATVGYNVGPTPYYIEIFDQATGARVAICGSGTSCAASISYPGTTTHTYIAYVASAGLTNPPPNIQATSNTVTVNWYYLG